MYVRRGWTRNEDVINNLLGELYATEGKGCIHKLHIKISDEQAGWKVKRLSYLDRQNSWVPIERCNTETSD